MKDFWEDLGKRIGETAENMTAMAGDAIEIQRLKSQVRNLARGNAVDLMELGRTIYDRYKAGEEVEESKHPWVNMRRRSQRSKAHPNVRNVEKWWRRIWPTVRTAGRK